MKVQGLRHIDVYDAAAIWQIFDDPCTNCMHLLSQIDADPDKFKAILAHVEAADSDKSAK